MSFAQRLRAAWPWAAMLAVALYLYYVSGHFAFSARPGELGPDVWPRAIVVVLILVCAVRVVVSFVSRGPFAAEEAHERLGVAPDAAAEAVLAGTTSGGDDDPIAGEAEPQDEPPRYPMLLVTGIVLTILYVLTMTLLGFFLATALYLALFMIVGRYRRFGVIAAVSVIGSLVFVFVFMKVVYVSLPLGIGPFERLSLVVLAALGVH